MTIPMKARAANMPADNLKRAIMKGTGQLEGASDEELERLETAIRSTYPALDVEVQQGGQQVTQELLSPSAVPEVVDEKDVHRGRLFREVF